MIEGAILNWEELEQSDSELMIIMRCDIELATRKLSNRIVVNTVMLVGEGAFDCQAVGKQEFAATVSDLYRILNEEGIA